MGDVCLTSQYCFFYLLIYCALNSYLSDIKVLFAQTWQVSGNRGNSSFDGNAFIDFRNFCFYAIKFYFVYLIMTRIKWNILTLNFRFCHFFSSTGLMSKGKQFKQTCYNRNILCKSIICLAFE